MRRKVCIAVSFSTIRYYFREAFISIFRNSWFSAASVGVVAISLLILGSTLLLVINAREIIKNIEDDIEISVYLNEEAEIEDINRMQRDIKAMLGVAQVEYVPKERALLDMGDWLNDHEDLMAGLKDNNPLPNAFRVKAISPEHVPFLAQRLGGMEFTDKVRWGQEVVEKLMTLSRWIRVAGMVMMGLLGAAAVFLIATTIRLSVFARRKEIGIMKFLGATNWFVRMPFLLEGMFLGLVGSVFAVLVIYFGYGTLVSSVGDAIPFMKMVSDPVIIMYLMEGMLLLGLLIGLIGSMISIRKFLQV